MSSTDNAPQLIIYSIGRLFEGWSLWDYSSRFVYVSCKLTRFMVGYTWRHFKGFVRQTKESLRFGCVYARRKKFEYSPLPKPSSVRLLTIEDGSDTDIIRCSLNLVDLEDAPQYRALSYTWNVDKSPWAEFYRIFVAYCQIKEIFSPFTRRMLAKLRESKGEIPCRSILCDGRVMEVQMNLYNALIQLRRTHNDLPFWIDAVSINQEDISERNAQIAIMGNIYKSARQVIAWLGTCPTILIGRAESIRSIPKMRDEIKTNATAKLLPLHLQYEYMFEPTYNVTLLIYIFMSSHFSRIWTLQESILARELVFLIGPEEITTDSLATALSWVKDIDSPAEIRQVYLHTFPYLVPHIGSLDTVLASREPFHEGVRWNLEQYLLAARARYATDQRDLVFAGLALLSQSSLKIQRSAQLSIDQDLESHQESDDIVQPQSELTSTVDQTGSEVELISSQTSDLSESSEPPEGIPTWIELHADYSVPDLEVFANWAAAMIHSPTGLYSLSLACIRTSYHGYPSWFPLPERIDNETLLDIKSDIFNAMPLPNTFEISSDGKELWLEKAIPFDKIVTVSWDFLSNLDEVPGLTKFFDFMMDLDTSVYSKEPKYLTIARILVGDSCDGHHPAHENIGEMFGKWLRVVLADVYKEYPDFPGYEIMQNSYDAFIAEHLPFDPATFEETDVAAAADIYRRDHDRFCAERKMFITEKGYIGIGPECMKPEQQIIFVGGAYVPFVMRRDDDREVDGLVGEGKWSLGTNYYNLGELYMYGFMNGEVLVDEKVAPEPLIIG